MAMCFNVDSNILLQVINAIFFYKEGQYRQ